MAFRYNIEAARSRSTNVFRPNVLQGEPRAASLGALWIGKFEKLPSSKPVDIVWEAPESSRRVFWSHELLVIVCLKA